MDSKDTLAVVRIITLGVLTLFGYLTLYWTVDRVYQGHTVITRPETVVPTR